MTGILLVAGLFVVVLVLYWLTARLASLALWAVRHGR